MDLEKLEKLNELKEKGILSQEEFEKQKTILLNAPSAPQAGGVAAMPATTAMPAMPVINITQSQSNTQIAGQGGKAPQSRMLALLLCIFLGWFGAHRFYTGYPVLGLVYMFTLGLFGIGVVLDTLWLLFGSYKNAQGQYL